MTIAIPELRPAAILAFALALALLGCGPEDKRLTVDKKTCISMGHMPGFAAFEQCMGDLNERRCATVNRRGGGGHFATVDCTKLQSGSPVTSPLNSNLD